MNTEENKYMNTIIIIHNDVIDIPIENNHELNLIIWIINKLRNQKQNTSELDYDEIKFVAKLPKAYKPHEVTNFLDKMNRNFIKNKLTIFSLFNVDNKNKTLSVAMNEKYLYLNNNLKSNYCAFKMSELLTVKKSVQYLFLNIVKRRYLGYFNCSIDELIDLLNISNNIWPNNIRARYINPLIKSIQSDFKQLKCVEEGKGNNRTYKFTWSTNYQKSKKQKEINNHHDVKLTNLDFNDSIF